MQILFDLDKKDYKEGGKVFSRHSARGIVIRGEKLLLVYSKKYDYYKFPGGGIEKGEDNETALIREVLEETGYKVIPDSIREYGLVPRKQRDAWYPDAVFVQNNYYYFCDVEDEVANTNLDDYEAEEGFTAVWTDAFTALRCNMYSSASSEKDIIMIRREQRVFELVYHLILDRIHEQKRKNIIEGLGHPEYFEMADYVRTCLETAQTERIAAKGAINYSRFDHILHVVAWAKRLYDAGSDKSALKYDELMIAAIFHDVGRNEEIAVPHAETGAQMAEKYLLEHGYSEEKISYICMLIRRHSDKQMMKETDIDRNLLLLMEADLLDDMGALGIVMDCMITQKRKDDALFYDCYNHIRRYTFCQHQTNPMVSPEGRAFWDEKTRLVDAFDKALERDLGYC